MANENKFTTGQVVQLKSGGPEMTVECRIDNLPDESEVYTCQWFAVEELKQANFPHDSLKIVEPQPDEIEPQPDEDEFKVIISADLDRDRYRPI